MGLDTRVTLGIARGITQDMSSFPSPVLMSLVIVVPTSYNETIPFGSAIPAWAYQNITVSVGAYAEQREPERPRR